MDPTASSPSGAFPPPADWLRLLFERSAEAMTLLDPDGYVFLAHNEASARAVGLDDAASLAGLSPHDIAPEFQPGGRRSEEVMREVVALALERGSHRFEWQVKRRDGALSMYDVVATALVLEGRALLLSTARNIDERKRLEEHLRLSESRWRRVFEQAPLSLQIFAPDGTTREVNHAFEKLFHLLLPELEHFNIRTDAQLAAAGFRDHIEQAFAGGVSVIPPIPFELKAAPDQPARGVKWIGSTMFPVFDAQGRIAEVVCVHEDDTARHLAEEELRRLHHSLEQRIAERTEALRASEARFRQLFETSSQGVMLHDEHQLFADVNQAAAAIFGLTPRELIGRHPADLAPEFQPNGEPSAVVARRHIQECLERGRTRFEWTHLHAHGHEVLMEVVLSRITDGDRHLVQAVVTDISERRRAETELKRALERERELHQLKSDFVSMVSHEFRTPLGIIQSSAEILDDYLDQLDPAERREQLQSIIKNSRRMAGLMEDVLLLGRLDAGRMEFRPGPLDLAAFCRRLVDEVAFATEHKCPIGFSTAGLPAEARADERLLRHMLVNLLTNAVKYSDDGAPVTFQATGIGEGVRFVVGDRGIGIPEDEQPRLFEAFRRGSNVGQRPGTGLGLVIVKRSVELHGGAIRFHSRPGEGSRFTLDIPLSPLPPEP